MAEQTIYQALSAVMGDVQAVGKDGRNTQQGFNFRGIDAVVNPRAITVSSILQHVRRGRIKGAHSLRDGFAEILEMEALDTSAIVNTPIREIKRPKNMIFGLIVRDQKILVPKPDMVIKPDDRVIILASHDEVKKVEQMFAVRPEYF